MVVSDALAGKSVRCSGCGEMIFVQASPQGSGAAKTKQAESAGFYMSPALIGVIVGAVVLLIGGVLFYVGPMRVSGQWQAMDRKARNSVMNVITFAIKARLSEDGEYDPAHHAPAIESSDLLFDRPLLTMSLPEKIHFVGKSNNGGFEGYYNTGTGEVEADVECGGYTVAGLVNLKKPTKQIHIVGHEVNNDPVVQIDGRTVKIINPPKLNGKP